MVNEGQNIQMKELFEDPAESIPQFSIVIFYLDSL